MITIMVPAYNEEKYLKDTVNTIIRAASTAGNLPLDIVVVDDASHDRTAEKIQELEAEFDFVRSIRHTMNQGMGVSVKKTLEIAKYQKFLIIPGDNDISETSIAQFFKNHDKADMVLQYTLKREIRGRFRNVISTLFGTIYMAVFDIYILYINSPCIYSTEMLRSFDLKSRRFSCVAEMNTKCLRSGCTFYEMPAKIQRGIEGSTSFSMKSFAEVVRTFAILVYEIHFKNKEQFNKNPIRVYD